MVYKFKPEGIIQETIIRVAPHIPNFLRTPLHYAFKASEIATDAMYSIRNMRRPQQTSRQSSNSQETRDNL